MPGWNLAHNGLAMQVLIVARACALVTSLAARLRAEGHAVALRSHTRALTGQPSIEEHRLIILDVETTPLHLVLDSCHELRRDFSPLLLVPLAGNRLPAHQILRSQSPTAFGPRQMAAGPGKPCRCGYHNGTAGTGVGAVASADLKRAHFSASDHRMGGARTASNAACRSTVARHLRATSTSPCCLASTWKSGACRREPRRSIRITVSSCTSVSSGGSCTIKDTSESPRAYSWGSVFQKHPDRPEPPARSRAGSGE